MAKRQTRPLTPAEAVRRGQKLLAERRRREAARKAAMQPEAAGQGGAEAAIGMPISEQDQRVEAVAEVRVIAPLPATLNHSKADLRVADERDEHLLITPGVLRNRPRDMHAAMSVFPTSKEVPKTDTHPDGTWPLADLRSGQCRFACTADDTPRDQHRFCGRATRISRSNLHGSWCDEHLPRVWGQGSVSERFAHLVTKDVRRFG